MITRASSGAYLQLDEVVADVKVAATAILAEVRHPTDGAQTPAISISPELSEVASTVVAFRKKAEGILRVEKSLDTPRSSGPIDQSSDDLKGLTNGSGPSKSYAQLETGPGENRLVLTLFGNAPGAKQLFSSLQEPVKSRNGDTEVIQPLREAGLPYGFSTPLPFGISTTQIIPFQSNGLADEKKRIPTMGELFSTPTQTLPFPPPKPSRTATTRSSVVGWYQPSALEASRTQGNQSYYGQHIKSGQWLDYNGLPTSMDVKRRHRERALSLSGIKTTQPVDTADQEAAKLESLFRSAYSGFAPTRDDAAAIVPEGMINRVWWRKVGEKSFDRLIRNATNAEEVVNAELKSGANGNLRNVSDDLDLDFIEQAIQELDEDVIDPNLEDSIADTKSIEDKEVQEILEGISDLLETLNSYQRIRNLSLNPPVRPAVAASSPETVGTPSKPSEAETATYNTLKAQLSLMIAMLPPYAVAKLNSDQLADLNISTKIQVLTDSHKGVMEEDEPTARARVAQMHAANNSRPAAVTTHRSSTALYGNQYSAQSRPAVSSGQQYYGQQTPIRAPSTNLQRPPATAPMAYGGSRPASSTPYQPQAGYSTPTYPHQLPRNTPSQYGQSNSQQYYQTPSAQNYGQTQARSFGAVPASGQQYSARYQPSNQAAYQQNQTRPQALQNGAANGMEYRYNTNSSTAARQSPPKPQQVYSPQSQTSQMGSRPFGTPTPSSNSASASIIPQSARQYFPPQALTNGGGSISPQPQVSQQAQQQQASTGNLGATGYHTVMTPEQQSTMMERQRAQLAQQQGTQHQARNAAQAGAMSVSPAPQVNGGAVTAGH